MRFWNVISLQQMPRISAMPTLTAAASDGLTVFVPQEGAHICKRNGDITYFSLHDAGLAWDLAVIYSNGTCFSAISRLFTDFAKKIIH